jgi:uncharacterized phage-associated protein
MEAAKTLCELRGWKLSNLEIQKILYLAHMFYLGQTGEPLIGENFEAWDYGPVVPDLYHHVRGFGRSPVSTGFWHSRLIARGEPEFDMLEQAAQATKGVSATRLVSITHRPGGAWATHYRPDARGIIIPNEAIKAEYDSLNVTA